MYSDQLPFARGKVYGITASTDGAYLLGQEFVVEDLDYANLPKKRSNRLVTIRAVRNSSGIALLPKRLSRYKVATNNTEVDGYTTVTSEYFAGVVDEALPAAGAASNEVFFITVKGPSLCLTSIAAQATAVVAGDIMTSLTAATSQSTTAGHVEEAAFTGATAVLADQIMHRLGRALSARTTAETNADILIDIRCDY